MSPDRQLVKRVRTALGGRRELEEKDLFGGLAFLYRGHVVCGVLGDELFAHVGPDGIEDALAREGVRPMEFSGRPMSGMVLVRNEGIRTRPRLERWVRDALAYVSSMAARRPGPGGRS